MIDENTIEVIKNEYIDMLGICTENLVVKREKPPLGSLCLFHFTVNAPTYIITGPGDTEPKAVDCIDFYINVPVGYPKEKPSVYYVPGKILAGVNTFTTGYQCIDDWIYDANHAGNNSSLVGTVRKTVRAIIHDPTVTRFDSMANGSLKEWQLDKTNKKEFPSCSLSRVLKSDDDSHEIIPSLPKRNRSVTNDPPALPVRR